MEWNIYKEWLDINLYRQMVSMIYQSSSREDKMNFMRKKKKMTCFMVLISRAWRKNMVFIIPVKY